MAINSSFERCFWNKGKINLINGKLINRIVRIITK